MVRNWGTRLLLMVLSLVVPFQSAAATNCRAKCGNVTVEYPFSIVDGCRNSGPEFRLNCSGGRLQLNSFRIKAIDYRSHSISLSLPDSGVEACPVGRNSLLNVQICNKGNPHTVCLKNRENCCLRQTGNGTERCPLYKRLTVDEDSSWVSYLELEELQLVWPEESNIVTSRDQSLRVARILASETEKNCNSTNNSTCNSTTNGAPPGKDSTNKKPIVLSGALAIAVIVVVLVFGVSLSIYWKWKKNGREEEQPEPIFSMNDPKHQVDNLREIISSRRGEPAKLYTLAEIDKATNGFAKEYKIGHGGFGTVYRGDFEDGTVYAIKRANHTNKQSSQHFFNEVSILSQVNHRNLVRLLGCCIDTDVPILIYEYIPNGTLFDHLHKRAEVLSWSNRLRIAIETAEALAYLHSYAYKPIYHRDVKSANILLDNSYIAKVADFGLSRLVPEDVTHVSTMVQGTPGYVDPEYHQTYQLTDKSDVYSFGVVLLELVTGRKPVDFSRSSRDVNLSAYSVPLIRKGMFDDIIDPRLEVNGDLELLKSIKGMANIAVACLSFFREDRPTMKRVLEELLAIRGSAGLGQADYHWLEGEVILTESYNPSEGISYNSVGSRGEHTSDLDPR